MSRVLILTSSFGGDVAMDCGHGVRCDDATAARLLERELARELKPKEVEPETVHNLASSPKKAAAPGGKVTPKPTAVGSQEVPLADLLPFGLTEDLQTDLAANEVSTFDQLKAVKNLEKLKEIGRAKAKSIKEAMKAYEQAKETDSGATSESVGTEDGEVSTGEGSQSEGAGDQVADSDGDGLPEGSGQNDGQD